MSDDIRNNRDAERFEMTVDGVVAEIVYRMAPGIITLVHTGVPEALAGRGVGSMLARHALDYARREDLKVVVRCSFVARYIERHPEYADLLL